MSRFCEFALGTADSAVEIVFAIDNDDLDSIRMATVLMRGRANVSMVVGARRVLSDYWNVCARVAGGNILGLMGDDIAIRTKGWDRIVEQEFDRWPDRIVFVHGRDGLQDERLGTHGFLHRRWVDAVGHMTGGMFSMDYADTWINDVANSLGRRVYVSGLYTEHLHPAAGKSVADELHRERMANGARDNTTQLYADTLPEREEDIEILKGLMA